MLRFSFETLVSFDTTDSYLEFEEKCQSVAPVLRKRYIYSSV